MTEIRHPRDEDEFEAALAVRAEVFIREQGVSVEGDVDGHDAEALQLVAVADDGRVIGTCRVLPAADEAAHFGRLAVLGEARGHGLGTALLTQAERAARAAGAARMVLHAQVDALSLYERAGYRAFGNRFLDEGIEHQAMEKPLAGPGTPSDA